MPSPLGHALAGGLVCLLARPGQATDLRCHGTALLGAGLLAAAPDLDLLIGPLLGRPAGAFHHTFSHSLFTALLLGALFQLRIADRGLRIVAKIRNPQSETRNFWSGPLVFWVYASHSLLDLVGQDFTAPYGLQLLWPFSDRYFLSPRWVFLSIERGGPDVLFGEANLIALLLELLALGLPVAALLAWRRVRARGARPLDVLTTPPLL